MNRQSAILVLALLSTSAAVAEELAIEGVNIERSVACNGQDVGIYGSGNTIDLTGDCGAVIVHGDSHTVTFETAAGVTISGTDHTVSGGNAGALSVETTGHTVTATIAGSAHSAVTVDGTDQTVDLTFAGPSTLTVGGADHKVRWTLAGDASAPKVEITGANNSVTGP